MADIIKVEHLSYVYNPGMPNAVTALDDVSFAVEEGDFVGIIGATGSGKSTLITHMNGLNKPTSGKIYIDGRDLWADPEKIRDFRFLTGLVFQYPEYQLFEETCYKDIAFGPRNMGLEEAEIDRRVHEAADFVGLDPALLERSPFELSGGQKRRVAVAGVMAMRPRILVLDEPVDGLDPVMRRQVWSLLMGDVADHGTTVLVSSHNLRELEDICDHVGLLHRGGILFSRDLDDMKLGMYKMQCIFPNSLPDSAWEGFDILHKEQRGSLYTITARGSREELLARVNALNPTFCEMLPLTLE